MSNNEQSTSNANNESEDSFEEFGGNDVNYNRLFETVTCFASRDEAFEWAQKIAFDNGFALIKASNGAKNRKQPELLGSYFRCSRYGRTRKKIDPDIPEKPKKKGTPKCECLFRVRASQKGGYHNHEVTKYKDGHRHFAGLNAEEKEFVRQQVRASIPPKDIKNGLHQRTPDKPQPTSTQIYSAVNKFRREVRGTRNTARQMLDVAVASKSGFEHARKKAAKVSTPATTSVQHTVGDFDQGPVGAPLESGYTKGFLSTWNKKYAVPEEVRDFFDGWVDVGNDGHCGYRVVSHVAGRESDYLVMRELGIREIKAYELYKDFFAHSVVLTTGLTRYEEALRRMEFTSSGGCGPNHWMYGEYLFVFASLFNRTICVIAKDETTSSLVPSATVWHMLEEPPIGSLCIILQGNREDVLTPAVRDEVVSDEVLTEKMWEFRRLRSDVFTYFERILTVIDYPRLSDLCAGRF
ncbi:uncharacterized protein LOC141628279 [Silene latifolia]|uniref:uncharacterized protein LOC141628279 n=1 Tax=Silene latifolia TaxID=37657 RepID=UPI003D76D2EB